MGNDPPMLFEARLGGLFPANRMAEETMKETRGKVTVTIKGGQANQRRRSLYWACANLVCPILNDKHNLTLTEQELHDITRDKFGMFDEIALPSGQVLKRYHSTSNRAMNESARSEYTNRALDLWSRWIGIDATTLRDEGERER